MSFIDRLDDFFSRKKLGKYTAIMAAVVGLIVSISTYFAKDPEPQSVTVVQDEPEPLPEPVAPAASTSLGYGSGEAQPAPKEVVTQQQNGGPLESAPVGR